MISVSIVGASGYSGIELLKILLKHPKVSISKIFANTSAGKKIAEIDQSFNNVFDKIIEKYSAEAIYDSDLIFIALPSGEAMSIVPEILKMGKRVIDLGGDFRLKDASLYEKYYNRKHQAEEFLSQAVYGLPEWNAEKIRNAKLLSNPGCYPTSAILPLAPLLKDRLINSEGIVINSLSGVSGAGRSSSPELSFVEVNESVRAYKVGVHQHIPEIVTVLNSFSTDAISVSFVPHLLPITRGIYTTIYAKLKNNTNENELLECYKRYYSNAPFVRFSGTFIPEIKNVVHTNFIDIGFRINRETNQVIILSVIDNLVKGAAGQAVQNMNLMFGFDETEGLK